ncbi:MAG TPA: S8 family serine peptidase [Acidimicrobiales bacterium]|nr:S8 family serine peptidase [Acidimicrobiales bacterium]
MNTDVHARPTALVAVLAAAALTAGAVALPLRGPNAAPARDDVGLAVVDPHDLDDGFNHFVVKVDEAAPAPVPSPTPGAVRARVPVAEVGGRVDPDSLRAAAGGGRVVGLERGPLGLEAVVEAPAPVAPTPPAPELSAVEAVPGTRRVQPVGGGWYAVTSTAGIADYRQVPGVRSVTEDVRLVATSADPGYAQQWHLRNTGGGGGVAGADIGAEAAWQVADGSGVVVAVVDTGMEISHPDLAADVWTNPGEVCGNGVDDDRNGHVDDCHGWDFYNDDATVQDSGVNRNGVTIDNFHATHVAGLIAAVTDNGIGVAGVAHGARVMPVKVSDTGSMLLSLNAAGIRYAVDNGARIVNCSFGSMPGATLAQVQPLEDAIRYAASRGVLVVAAAGNNGVDIDANPIYPAAFAEDNVLTVGSSTNADQRSSFSNWGARSVDLFAPGSNIMSTAPGASYQAASGTSMATPITAGAAALVMQARPDLDPAGVKAALMGGSTPVAAFAGNSVSGTRLDAGRVLNPYAADGGPAFTFNGFGSAVEGQAVAASISAVAPAGAPPGADVGYRATLLTAEGGETYGVAGATLTTDAGTVVTDDQAAAPLSPAGGYAPAGATRDLPVGFSLPAGSYALVAQAYTVADGSDLGRPWAVFFTVAAPPAAPTTTTTTTTAPPPAVTTTTTVAPRTSPTTVPPTTTTPRPAGVVTTTTTRPVAGIVTTTTRPPAGVTTTTRAPAAVTTTTTRAPATTTTRPPAVVTTTTTRAPVTTTTRPAATTTTTRAPVTTTTRPVSVPAPTTTTMPLPPPPPPASDGRLTVTALSPRSGSTAGDDLVRIDGQGFTDGMHVLFGTSPAAWLWVLSPTTLLAVTPARVAGGAVDVRVSSPVDSVVLRGAYTYVAPTPVTTPPTTTAPTTTSTTAVVARPPSPSSTSTTTTTRPATTAPTTAPPATTGPSTTTTTTAPAPPRFAFGTAVATRGTLRLVALLGTTPLSGYPPSAWPALRCIAARCAGTRL